MMEDTNRNDTMRNTTSCVSASPDVQSESPAKAAKKPAANA